ncbi:hypothetical protein BDA96_04G119800 [Sorghum bicolor]|uniref:Uncharacterized protein n=2 Tax=Sorghum bicolor TaxID=4558 RepID=A0A921UI81_SORBI|nr:hypothetical protein BDA96_04G119800 [Sorghum bicolor]KXG29932.1 hypothetical protein SORBI_3004G111300 [Sorghum bicolor]
MCNMLKIELAILNKSSHKRSSTYLRKLLYSTRDRKKIIFYRKDCYLAYTSATIFFIVYMQIGQWSSA